MRRAWQLRKQSADSSPASLPRETVKATDKDRAFPALQPASEARTMAAEAVTL